MNHQMHERLQRIIAIAWKDTRELIRDRRTLFVNLLLPVMLYPMLAMLVIQVQQIAKPKKADVPAIALLPGSEIVDSYIPFIDDSSSLNANSIRRAELDTASLSALSLFYSRMLPVTTTVTATATALG